MVFLGPAFPCWSSIPPLQVNLRSNHEIESWAEVGLAFSDLGLAVDPHLLQGCVELARSGMGIVRHHLQDEGSGVHKGDPT